MTLLPYRRAIADIPVLCLNCSHKSRFCQDTSKIFKMDKNPPDSDKDLESGSAASSSHASNVDRRLPAGPKSTDVFTGGSLMHDRSTINQGHSSYQHAAAMLWQGNDSHQSLGLRSDSGRVSCEESRDSSGGIRNSENEHVCRPSQMLASARGERASDSSSRSSGSGSSEEWSPNETITICTGVTGGSGNEFHSDEHGEPYATKEKISSSSGSSAKTFASETRLYERAIRPKANALDGSVRRTQSSIELKVPFKLKIGRGGLRRLGKRHSVTGRENFQNFLRSEDSAQASQVQSVLDTQDDTDHAACVTAQDASSKGRYDFPKENTATKNGGIPRSMALTKKVCVAIVAVGAVAVVVLGFILPELDPVVAVKEAAREAATEVAASLKDIVSGKGDIAEAEITSAAIPTAAIAKGENSILPILGKREILELPNSSQYAPQDLHQTMENMLPLHDSLKVNHTSKFPTGEH